MNVDDFRLLIEKGNVDGIRGALGSEPALANQTIRWFLNQQNESDPLHYVSECFGHGWLVNGREGEIAEILLAYGAAIEGTEDRESPLIGSASLGAEKVSKVLVEAGAALESTSIFGSRALHWAAWIGTPSTVELLVAHNANIEARCSEFGATPLFWPYMGTARMVPSRRRIRLMQRENSFRRVQVSTLRIDMAYPRWNYPNSAEMATCTRCCINTGGGMIQLLPVF